MSRLLDHLKNAERKRRDLRERRSGTADAAASPPDKARPAAPGDLQRDAAQAEAEKARLEQEALDQARQREEAERKLREAAEQRAQSEAGALKLAQQRAQAG